MKKGRKKSPQRFPNLGRTLNNAEFRQLKKHLYLTYEEMAYQLGISTRFCQKLASLGKDARPISRKVHNDCMYLLSQNPIICPRPLIWPKPEDS